MSEPATQQLKSAAPQAATAQPRVEAPESTMRTAADVPQVLNSRAGDLPHSPWISEFVRRCADVTVSIMALIISAPIILLLAIIIRIDSPGPALFFQERVGRNRRRRSWVQASYTGPERRVRNVGGPLFTFVKLRSMFADAEERHPELYAYQYTADEVDTLQFKPSNDPRHTRFGKWLRKTSLDELPNFWNCLMGDMTLVGSRPDIPEMTQYYLASQRAIFEFKPGITGYAQIRGRCGLSFRQTKSLDLEYIRERSLWVDFKTLLRTLASVLRAHGAF